MTRKTRLVLCALLTLELQALYPGLFDMRRFVWLFMRILLVSCLIPYAMSYYWWRKKEAR